VNLRRCSRRDCRFIKTDNPFDVDLMATLFQSVMNIVFAARPLPAAQQRWLQYASIILTSYGHEFWASGLTVRWEPYWEELHYLMELTREASLAGGRLEVFSSFHTIICQVCVACCVPVVPLQHCSGHGTVVAGTHPLHRVHPTSYRGCWGALAK
jgi:hypothetical protein